MTGADQQANDQDRTPDRQQTTGVDQRDVSLGARLTETYRSIDPPTIDVAAPGAGQSTLQRVGGEPVDATLEQHKPQDEAGSARYAGGTSEIEQQHRALTSVYHRLESPTVSEHEQRDVSASARYGVPNDGADGQARSVDQAERLIAERARELQDLVPEGARSRITMSNGSGIDEHGTTRVVVGTSEPRGYLRPGVVLNDNEELATGPGHAEVSVLAYMRDNGIAAEYIGAGRPICDNCADSIEQAGAAAVTEYKNPNRPRNP